MTAVDWRRIIREQLEILASEQEQLMYERNVPHVDITKELVAGWFDDSYHPKSEAFVHCFTAHELLHLAQFNEVYEDRLPSFQTVRALSALGLNHLSGRK